MTRMMEEAKDLKSVKCECGKQVEEKILRDADEVQWSSLKQIESGVVTQSYAATVKLFKCCNCSIDKPIDVMRRLFCGHDYCELCLKNMMRLYKSGPHLKCKCSSEIEKDVLNSVDKALYENYLPKVSKNNPSGKRK